MHLISPRKNIALGSDHAGFDYKKSLIEWLKENRYSCTDHGAHSEASVDYPNFAHAVAQAVAIGDADFGILLCGSGNGMAMTANKQAGIRAALAWNTEISKLARQHNNANILCLPARFIGSEQVVNSIVQAFLDTEFEKGGRHENRVANIENKASNNQKV